MTDGPWVLLVDSSAIRRDILRTELRRHFDLKVCQTFELARHRFSNHDTCALVAGLEDGSEVELEFLSWLEAQRKTPVLLTVATEAQRSVRRARWECLVRPPVMDGDLGRDHAAMIAAWLRKSANAPRPDQLPASRVRRQNTSTQRFEMISQANAAFPVICIGISTGGPDTLEEIFRGLPCDLPPIVVVQHMPRAYTAPLAERLNRTSVLQVCEAHDGQELVRGQALIAPGDRHLRLVRRASRVIAELDDSPPVDRHRPSVNILFESAAVAVGRATIALIMTGMGDDGVRGLLALRNVGATTLAQDAESSTVFGMPQRAIEAGAAEYVVSLRDIPDRLVELATRVTARA